MTTCAGGVRRIASPCWTWRLKVAVDAVALSQRRSVGLGKGGRSIGERVVMGILRCGWRAVGPG